MRQPPHERNAEPPLLRYLPAVVAFLEGRLPLALLTLSSALLAVWLGVGNPGVPVVLAVLVPIATLWALLIPVAVLPRWERRCASRIGEHRSFVLSVASAGMGGVLVALAVMLSVIDAPVWKALADAEQLVARVAAPTFTWFAALSAAVWGFVAYGVYAATAWPPLRRAAAGVAFTAAIALPLFIPLVAFPMWSLADARIAGGSPP